MPYPSDKKPLNSLISNTKKITANINVMTSQVIVFLSCARSMPFSASMTVPLLDKRKIDDMTTVTTLNKSDAAGPSEEGVKIRYVINNVRNMTASTPR